MGNSIVEQSLKEAVDKLLDEPEWALALVKVFKDLNNDVYPESYVDIMGQKWREQYDLYDAFAFSQINLAITEGKIALFQIPIEVEPFPDKEIEKNNAALENLKYPFSGKFYGGTQGADGYIHWDLPINALLRVEEKISFVVVESLTDEKGRHATCPLEVGYIPFAKTFHYLRKVWLGTGPIPGLARWPYGQNKITVLVNHGFFVSDDDCFKSLVQRVYGDFHTLPNPWESWLYE